MSSVKDLLRGDVVDGSGTANYVSKWSDADTITNSVIYDDGTNVGINDSLGYGKLTLKTSGTFTFDSNDGDFSGVNLTLKTDNTSANEVGSGIVWIKGGTDNRKVAAITNYTYSDPDQAGLNFYVQPTPSGSSAGLSEAMRIDSSGNVGIGTSSPNRLSFLEKQLAIESTQDGGIHIIGNRTTADSGVGYLTFFNDSSSVSTFNKRIAGITAATGSNAESGVMQFLTSDTSGTLSERMRITSGGDVLIGKSTTVASVEGIQITKGSEGFVYTSTWSTTSTKPHLAFYNPNGQVGTITTSGSSTAYNTSSDYRLKENVVPMEGALGRVGQLQPSRFNFIADPNTTVDGFLAHQVQEVVPEAVTGEKDAVDEEGNPVYQGIDQSKLVPLLVGAIQELKAEIELLKSQK